VSKSADLSIEDILDPKCLIGNIFCEYHAVDCVGLVVGVQIKKNPRRGDDIVVVLMVDGNLRYTPYKTFFDFWNYY
jgi:hypothetical protein